MNDGVPETRQKSGAALTTFFLFNTWGFPASYAEYSPLLSTKLDYRENPEGSRIR